MAQAAAVNLENIERANQQTLISKVLYVLRRWPVFPIFIIVTLVVSAVFAPIIAPNEPIKQDLRAKTDAPFWYETCGTKQNPINNTEVPEVPWLDKCRQTGENFYLLGADALGRGLLTRIIYGARVSLVLAAVAIIVGTLVGTVLGLSAGYFGGVLDELIMRLTDVATAIPYLLLALIIVIVLGQKVLINGDVIVLVLALASWPGIVRLVRGQTLQLKSLDYVALAQIAGASTFRIMYRHILPGVTNTIVVATTLQVGSIILAESILSFLGAGVPPPTPTWGSMVADGRDYLSSAWWVAFFPGMAIFLTVLAFNFIGDWLRDRWDPRLRQL
ncbi:MAG: ABC transporter permease [Chloroflexota bacterium]|nr:ABC transporter permease [Chloroflexota bacterium]MDE2686130.1 ABC transporter permease [Chloroflexota bacterium]